MMRLKATRIALERDEALTTLLGIPEYNDYFQSLLIENTEESGANDRGRIGTGGGTDESDAETVVNHGSPSALRVSSSTDSDDQAGFPASPQTRIHDLDPNQVQDGELGDDEDEEEEEVEERIVEDEYQAEQEIEEEESSYSTPLEAPPTGLNYIHWSSFINSVESSPVQVANSIPRQTSQPGNPFSALLEMVTLPPESERPTPRRRRSPRRRFFPIPVDSDSDAGVDGTRLFSRRFRPTESFAASAPNSPIITRGSQRWLQSPARNPHVFEDLDPGAVSPSRQRSRFRRQAHRVRRRIRFTPEAENHNHAADERRAFVEAFNATGPDGQLLVTPPRRPIQPRLTR